MEINTYCTAIEKNESRPEINQNDFLIAGVEIALSQRLERPFDARPTRQYVVSGAIFSG